MPDNITKSKIKHHFNKAYKTYDAYCTVQNNASQRALELLMPHSSYFEVIADFACGTGESTLKLIKQIRHEKCYAVDFSDKLLSIAQNKLLFPVNCILSDFDEKLFPDDFLDLVFCNMGLQWSLALEKTLILLNRYLTKSGYFVFSVPVSGNFPEIRAQFKSVLFSPADIIRVLNKSGFKIVDHYSYKHIQSFQSHYQALKSLQALGANFSPGLRHDNRGLKKINVREVFVEECILPQLTYCIGIYLCQKASL
ncbi:MAG: bioC [Gammaproteobacteria bacterium]|jgi:malonyl-CoA O-methyltransferase|nr:bioC [Gammaproteobacteria bacterium]